MTEYLRNVKLDSIESWGKVFQNIDIFRPVIEMIFKQENISINRIGNLTPGSNAVFRVDDYVIKIYVPKEVKELHGDFDIELEAMQIANKNKVNTPKVIAHGSYEDVYSMPYIIMEFAKGVEATEILSSLGDIEKKELVDQLNDVLDKLNTKSEETKLFQQIDGKSYNERWNMFPIHIREQVTANKAKLDLKDKVFVHGDLTGENVLVQNNNIQVIDFGDVRLAPYYYEYAPIVFELFDCDPTLLRLFSEGKENFIDKVFNAILIHEFGANIVRDFCQRHLEIEHGDLIDIQVIKDYLKKTLIVS